MSPGVVESGHLAELRLQHRSELGDLNVIIQVEEWHSSDRLHGTVRAPRSAQIRALKCRWVSLGVTLGDPGDLLDIVAGQNPPTPEIL